MLLTSSKYIRMARTRHIKFSFFENEELGVEETDPLISLMFVGLWCLADRDGRLEDRPLKIKGKLFPLRKMDNPDAVLQWLANHGFIVRYTAADSKKYIQVVNFTYHQNPHPNEKASIIPRNTPKNEDSLHLTKSNVMQPCAHALTSFPSLPSFPSLENGATQAEAAAIDPVERRIWRDGIDLMTKNGMTEAHARPLLGRLVKQYSKPKVAEAIAVTQAENPADPKAFLIGVLRDRSGERGRAKSQVGTISTAYVPEPPCDICGKEICLQTHREERGI